MEHGPATPWFMAFRTRCESTSAVLSHPVWGHLSHQPRATDIVSSVHWALPADEDPGVSGPSAKDTPLGRREPGEGGRALGAGTHVRPWHYQRMASGGGHATSAGRSPRRLPPSGLRDSAPGTPLLSHTRSHGSHLRSARGLAEDGSGHRPRRHSPPKFVPLLCSSVLILARSPPQPDPDSSSLTAMGSVFVPPTPNSPVDAPPPE